MLVKETLTAEIGKKPVVWSNKTTIWASLPAGVDSNKAAACVGGKLIKTGNKRVIVVTRQPDIFTDAREQVEVKVHAMLDKYLHGPFWVNCFLEYDTKFVLRLSVPASNARSGLLALQRLNGELPGITFFGPTIADGRATFPFYLAKASDNPTEGEG